ncbi:hypothetical protein, partial [Candidatus Thiosymbion oneisti]|uniref:hypothetical protein n=1 Tax=Candidatus Thiosymbion oneisti TaxID=589554 RepID=UPI001AAD07E3
TPDDQLDRQLGIRVLPGNQKSRQYVGGPGSRQNVGGPRGRQDVGGSGDASPAGTAVFQTAYGPHHQLSATLRADAFSGRTG